MVSRVLEFTVSPDQDHGNPLRDKKKDAPSLPGRNKQRLALLAREQKRLGVGAEHQETR